MKLESASLPLYTFLRLLLTTDILWNKFSQPTFYDKRLFYMRFHLSHFLWLYLGRPDLLSHQPIATAFVESLHSDKKERHWGKRILLFLGVN